MHIHAITGGADNATSSLWQEVGGRILPVPTALNPVQDAVLRQTVDLLADGLCLSGCEYDDSDTILSGFDAEGRGWLRFDCTGGFGHFPCAVTGKSVTVGYVCLTPISGAAGTYVAAHLVSDAEDDERFGGDIWYGEDYDD